MHREIDTILFDLDGTLINTNDHILHAFEYAFQEVLGESIDPQTAASTFGMPLLEALSFLRPQHAEALHQAYQTYSKKRGFSDITTFPHALQVLKELKLSDYRIGIVTSRRRHVAQDFLKRFDLDMYVDCLIGPEDCIHRKPHPEPVIKALTRLQAQAERAVMVGDSVHDIIAGKKAGTKTIGVTYAAQGIKAMQEANCDAFIDRLPEIIDLLKDWNR